MTADETCDYRKRECSQTGLEINGRWYCVNHLPERNRASMRNVMVPENAIVITLTANQHHLLWSWIKEASKVCDTLPHMRKLPKNIIAKLED